VDIRKYKRPSKFTKYYESDFHYVEVFVNVRRIVRVQSLTQEDAFDRASYKEERKYWKNHGYEFVDCDYNTSNKQDFDDFRNKTRVRK
jgi:predicted GNAT superfamily acetyltransferase